MSEINTDKLIYLPSESRYGVDYTLVAAHIWPVHVPDGIGISHIHVGHVATPWNRLAIIPDILSSTLRASSSCSNRSGRFSPRHYASHMEVQVSRLQEVMERPLISTTTIAHSTPPNCRF